MPGREPSLEERDREFLWRDGERTILFRQGLLSDACEVLRERGWDRYELLTTPRALEGAPAELASNAVALHEVPAGPVPEVSAAILPRVTAPMLVAFGGGRVIDSAKAIGAVRDGRVCAIPTTLSGAEMTTIHRLPEREQAARLIRPQLVLADQSVMTSQPEAQLRASAMNALAHGADSLYTPTANPVSRIVALRGAELIAGALDQPPAGRDRASLGLGSLLCAYALDSALFALHHVVCQSLVRVLQTPHAETNATMLPHTMEAMRDRAPVDIGRLAAALSANPSTLASRIEALGGGPRRLGELGTDRARIDVAVETILARGELQMTPDPPEAAEIRQLVERAW